MIAIHQEHDWEWQMLQLPTKLMPAVIEAWLFMAADAPTVRKFSKVSTHDGSLKLHESSPCDDAREPIDDYQLVELSAWQTAELSSPWGKVIRSARGCQDSLMGTLLKCLERPLL